MRILVVEQDAIIALHLQTTLLDLNFRPVGPAASLDEAQTLLARTAVDAAIIDLHTFGAVERSFIENLTGRNIPVLITSGLPSDTFADLPDSVPVIFKPYSSDLIQQKAVELAEKAEECRLYMRGMGPKNSQSCKPAAGSAIR